MLAFVTRWWKPLLALGLLLLAGQCAASHYQAALTTARAEAEAARRETRAALEAAARAASRADSLRATAARHDSLATHAERRADQAERALIAVRARYELAASAAPDTCRPALALADSALRASDSVAVELRSALSEARQGTIALQAALDTTSAALSALRGSAGRLEVATGELGRSSRPSILSRLKPRLGVGVTAGVDATGVPRLVAGLQVGIPF